MALPFAPCPSRYLASDTRGLRGGRVPARLLHGGDAAPAPSASSKAGALGAHLGLPRAQKVARRVRGTLAESSAQGRALIQAGDWKSARSTFCAALHLTASTASASCPGSLEDFFLRASAKAWELATVKNARKK